ncbi:MAG: menaquinone biosynthesis protein [Planctomycetes bacterium]|jgi:predicted solute-binding protein|nr:menaquinone biosynthesis protein [Planctomycetota bacterium]MCL4729805.1 menaquinone biosynthesis protein [Planctomycetota bacterium]
MQPLRVGVVSYLNAMPLWFALRHDSGVELIPDTPARLADRMAAGGLDLGLLPVIEALRQPGLELDIGLGVGADGLVESVGLFTRKDLPEITTVAVTSASRTSVALCRMVLGAAGADPAYLEAALEPAELRERREDAVLMIGDACLAARRLDTDRVWVDLAAEWKLLTDLPLVFAVWAARPGVLSPAVRARLRQTLTDGRNEVFELVRQAAMDTGWSEADLARYLTETIQHELTPQHHKGLLEFTRRAIELGLLPRGAMDAALDATR